MTDTDTDTTDTHASSATEPAPAEPVESTESTGDRDADRESTARNLRRYLNYAVLAGLVLLGVVAALQFYLAAGATINRWVAAEYRSLFRAAFNLAVLLLAALGVSVQLRRLV
ncbi:hypothetical protein [Candidatus Halobonum tyrrellensis]|uniref:DUF8060 domain-containing protein n=1 Tax=Candidatus Halobonum tyrrellensis G22 TaxID=1324957 RepID=V4J0F8_9EURY|nr:hypothetical protein [Candidatus Halobonum tyrrellensis]ESP88932.1 hypothetical protein K933_06598 [Candidatus Halobonum tyrrellensis G22]